MKDMTKITKALRVLLVGGFLLSTSFLRAQSCNVTINNNLACNLQLDISFFETTLCAACPGNPISVTVANGGGSATLNCAAPGQWQCTSTICDISVTFTNPVPSPAGPYLYSAGTKLLSGLPAACGASTSANITFTATTIDINP